jgi:hypothetical protein
VSVQRFKVALNNAVFPLVSTKAQRAAFVPGLDAAPRTPRIFMGADASADYNMAQIIYAENVMPVAEGIKSVGYTELIPSASPSTTAFDTVFPLRDDQENVVLYSPAQNNNYVHNLSTNAWTALGSVTTIQSKTLATGFDPLNSRVTYAYVDGKTFVCYSRLKATDNSDMSIMQWNSATNTLQAAGTAITNLPFPAGEIDGISSSSGYLIVWSGLIIAWAPFNGTAFDFQIYANGAFTGAGFQIPEDIQGPITAIIPVAGGFIAFTLRNAIGASYHAQSISAPWVFREVPNAGGLSTYEQASVEGSLANVYAYTSAGMQSINLNSAETLHPEVSDFITSRQTERYDFASHNLVQGGVSVDLYIKLTAIGNRYLVVSYGYYPGTYSYALVYDIPLQRWGKLRVVHRDCFSYVYTASPAQLTYSMLLDVSYDDTTPRTYEELVETGEGITAAQNAMAFVTSTGAVKVATWADRGNGQDAAVAIIGRVQLSRSSNAQLNRIEAEGLRSGNIYVHASVNGRNIDRVEDTVIIEQSDGFQLAGCMIDCKNFNVVVEGSFDLSTVILEARTTGRM